MCIIHVNFLLEESADIHSAYSKFAIIPANPVIGHKKFSVPMRAGIFLTKVIEFENK